MGWQSRAARHGARAMHGASRRPATVTLDAPKPVVRALESSGAQIPMMVFRSSGTNDARGRMSSTRFAGGCVLSQAPDAR